MATQIATAGDCAANTALKPIGLLAPKAACIAELVAGLWPLFG